MEGSRFRRKFTIGRPPQRRAPRRSMSRNAIESSFCGHLLKGLRSLAMSAIPKARENLYSALGKRSGRMPQKDDSTTETQREPKKLNVLFFVLRRLPVAHVQ